MKYKVGDRVYYANYLAQVVSIAPPTHFRHIPRYLIDPYPDQLSRRVVKETELLEAHV